MAFDFRTRAPRLASGKDMDQKIENAIRDGNQFYIGAAKQEGTAYESLIKFGIGSQHHIDWRLWGSHYLHQLFYTGLTLTENVREIEDRLIKEHKADKPTDLCLNGKNREAEDIPSPTVKGIVYLRIYKEMASPEFVTDEEIKSEIEKAIKVSALFYIGAACRNGTAKESLEHRGRGSKHHIDNKVSGYASLSKLLCTHLMSKEAVCFLEESLIEKYIEAKSKNKSNRKEDAPTKLCLNGKSGEENCIKVDTEKGIVYLRVYRKLVQR